MGFERVMDTSESPAAYRTDSADIGPSRFRLAPGAELAPVDRALAAILVALSAVSILFLVHPALDLWFTAQFHDREIGFAARRIPALGRLRDLNSHLVIAVAAGALISLAAKLALPKRPSIVPARASLFLLSSLVIGPGLLVNAILKEHWGRPRPRDIVEFGGSLPFSGAWQAAEHCLSNCSFVSGEASSAIWLTALALVVPKGFARPVFAWTTAIAALVSLNRIAFGGHFLSDVLIAWALTLFVTGLLYRLIYVSPPPAISGERLEAGLTALGLRLRRRAR